MQIDFSDSLIECLRISEHKWRNNNNKEPLTREQMKEILEDLLDSYLHEI